MKSHCYYAECVFVLCAISLSPLSATALANLRWFTPLVSSFVNFGTRDSTGTVEELHRHKKAPF